jgi:hypothetical protein
MEIILEQEDVERLLRAALKMHEVKVPDEARCLIRQNHKRGTIRVVFTDQGAAASSRPRSSEG